MNYLKISEFDTANGKGIGVVLWVSGCTHCCPKCHNPQTWDFKAGEEFTGEVLEKIMKLLDRSFIKRITFSGGDPLHPVNGKIVAEIAGKVKERFPDKKVWCYTGYTFEQLDKSLLEHFDVLVDGEFVERLHDVKLRFRGSSNQRVIDVQKSLKDNCVCLYEV